MKFEIQRATSDKKFRSPDKILSLSHQNASQIISSDGREKAVFCSLFGSTRRKIFVCRTFISPD
jgi:hypothetical protein